MRNRHYKYRIEFQSRGLVMPMEFYGLIYLHLTKTSQASRKFSRTSGQMLLLIWTKVLFLENSLTLSSLALLRMKLSVTSLKRSKYTIIPKHAENMVRSAGSTFPSFHLRKPSLHSPCVKMTFRHS